MCTTDRDCTLFGIGTIDPFKLICSKFFVGKINSRLTKCLNPKHALTLKFPGVISNLILLLY